ncbi:MAG: ABC transporter permease [Dehalococcoidia bacterium]|nr:ABC transporter permease [Dehalococcoidia bacterium]
MGRDVFDRTMYGGRISIVVGGAVGGISTILGLAIGLVAGYYRKVDAVIMRFMDGLMAFPSLILALALIAVLGASVQNVIIVITIVSVPLVARVVRASVLSLREQQFIDAAKALGVPDWRILMLHIAPNTLAVLMVQGTFVFALAVIAEANLSFLGAGVPPTTPSWGNIMGEGRTYLSLAFWVTFFPGVFLSLTVLAINLLGDGLRDALDPKLRRRA